MRVWIGILPVSLALAAPTMLHAQEQTRFGVNVAANGGYSNNPFGEAQSSGSGFVSVDIQPQLRVLTERSTFIVPAAANVQQYLTN